ncbi:prolyl oligopeptidase family serine peptidase [Bacteroides sp.]|uniref:alpha/beta hydrolase family protein n=1 Tax=Bacteroides sp. TaxID=29523 RepID=UPI0025856060|nr:prolyl oligopeptidase family serine peptidase [Bacteroides sp.]
MYRFFFLLFSILSINTYILSAQNIKKDLPVDGGEIFQCKNRTAFLIMPSSNLKSNDIPWVFYAPTLPGLPKEEGWLFQKLLDNGIAIAGIDVGESYGNPEGRQSFTDLYNILTTKKKLSKKVSLLARSRGGLMLFNWAAENPEKVLCIAGIYPVSNLLSYPGIEKASKAYGYSEKEFIKHLKENNPIDHLDKIIEYKIPMYYIHGDIDKTVPLKDNSAIMKARMDSLGGNMKLDIIKGQGHNLWDGWFHNEQLLNFILNNTHE